MRVLLILSLFTASVSALVTTSVAAEKLDIETFSSSLEFAQVTYVDAIERSSGNWCFNTSVRHNDQGWEHYADGWEVLDLKGNQLAYRKLGHPHDNEQPFTRQQCGIKIPSEMSQVIVRAKCNKHGYGGAPIMVDLSTAQNAKFSVHKYN